MVDGLKQEYLSTVKIINVTVTIQVIVTVILTLTITLTSLHTVA